MKDKKLIFAVLVSFLVGGLVAYFGRDKIDDLLGKRFTPSEAKAK